MTSKEPNGVASPPAMIEKTDHSEQNSDHADPKVVILPPAGKPWLKPWQPGQSGNPSGRPKNLSRLARALTNDGEDCAQLWLRMLKGEEAGTEGKPGLRWRAWASQRLAERGWGRPGTPIDIRSRSERINVDISAGGAPIDPETFRRVIGCLSTQELQVLWKIQTQLTLAQQQSVAALPSNTTGAAAAPEDEPEPPAA
jgi:hypothetical protein